MTNYLNRTIAVFDDCIRHIDSTKAEGSAVEAYLTQHLLVILCADIEIALHKLVEQRAQLSGDNKIAAYCLTAAKKVVRSVKKSDLADLLGSFDDSCRTAFNTNVDERDATSYGNVVTARHRVAHSSGAQMTLREFKAALAAAQNVLIAFEKSLA